MMQEMKQETSLTQMKKQTTLKVLALSILLIGTRMQSKEFKYYGLLGGEIEIQAKILMACKVISPGTVDKAKLLLAETIAVESRNGKATDHSKAYGEGLTQFDRGTFNYVKDHFSQSRYNDLTNRIKTLLQVNVVNAKYEDLRKSPMLSIVYARLRYYMISDPIPNTLLGRWLYYKKWFNSVQGATTQVKYMNAREYAVFKDEDSNKVA